MRAIRVREINRRVSASWQKMEILCDRDVLPLKTVQRRARKAHNRGQSLTIGHVRGRMTLVTKAV